MSLHKSKRIREKKSANSQISQSVTTRPRDTCQTHWVPNLIVRQVVTHKITGAGQQKWLYRPVRWRSGRVLHNIYYTELLYSYMARRGMNVFAQYVRMTSLAYPKQAVYYSRYSDCVRCGATRRTRVKNQCQTTYSTFCVILSRRRVFGKSINGTGLLCRASHII